MHVCVKSVSSDNNSQQLVKARPNNVLHSSSNNNIIIVCVQVIEDVNKGTVPKPKETTPPANGAVALPISKMPVRFDILNI